MNKENTNSYSNGVFGPKSWQMRNQCIIENIIGLEKNYHINIQK